MGESREGGMSSYDAAATASAVSSDMEAIFGRPAPRNVSRPPSPLPLVTAPPRRRGVRAAVLTGALATTVAGGLLAGWAAIGSSEQAPAKTTPTRRAAPPTAEADTARDPLLPPAEIASTSPLVQPPVLEDASEPVDEPSSDALAPSEPPAIVAPAPPRAEPVAIRDRPEPVRPIARPADPCATDGPACARAQLTQADRDVLDAYDMAAEAGARRRVLRDYRDEWDRARRLAAVRPQEALRIYGMIESDLRQLADEAAEGRE
jgi:hypothetical protein